MEPKSDHAPVLQEQPRTPKGEFAGKNTDAQTSAKGTDDGKGDQPDKLETARKRWKLPDSAWKALSDEERTQWASDAAKSQSEADRMATELAKFRKPETPKTTDATERAQGAQPVSTSNLRDLEDILAVDTESAKKIEAALLAPMRAEIAAYAKDRDELVSELDFMRGAFQQTLKRSAFLDMQGEFPDLKNSDFRARVEAQFAELSKLDKYDNAEGDLYRSYMDCLRDSCKVEAHDAQKQKAEFRARNQNQPSTKQLNASVKARYAGQPDHLMRYNMLADGYTPEQVRQVLD